MKIENLAAAAMAVLVSVAGGCDLQAGVGVRALKPFKPGEIRVGGEIGRRMDVTVGKMLHHTDVEKVFAGHFKNRKEKPDEPGGFAGYGMFLDALVKAAAHGIGGEEAVELKKRLFRELALAQTEDGQITMFLKEPGYWDNHENAYMIQALVRDGLWFGEGSSLDTAKRLADSLIVRKSWVTLGTETAFNLLYGATREQRYLDYLRDACFLDQPFEDYDAKLQVNGVQHVYTWIARSIGQMEYAELVGRLSPDDRTRYGAPAQEALRRAHGPYLSITGSITGKPHWAELWDASQIGLGNWGETCASAYLMRLCAKMSEWDGDSGLYDLYERVMYNAFFSAQSEDGLRYRYFTPFNTLSTWWDRDTYCCPNNYKRMVFEIPDAVFRKAGKGLAVCLFAPAELRSDGYDVKMATGYPEDGKVVIDVKMAPGEKSLYLRIPKWCALAHLSIGAEEQYAPSGWCEIRRDFSKGTRVTIEMPMPVRLVRGSRAQEGRVAVMRGPCVYALDAELNGIAKPDYEIDLWDLDVAHKLLWSQDKHAVEAVLKFRHRKRTEKRVLLTRYCSERKIRTYFEPVGPCDAVEDEIAPGHVAEAGVLGTAVRVEGVGDWAMAVAIEKDRLYALAGGKLCVLDISDPLNPRLLGSVVGMDNHRQVVVEDGFAYVVSRETGLRIVDCTDPKSPRIRSRYDSVEMATGVEVVGKTVFLSERIYGIEVVDVSDPDRPKHVCMRKTDESQSSRYSNGYLYSGEWGSGQVSVFDAHDMSSFKKIGTLPLGGFGDGVEIADGYLYCSTGHDARNQHAEEVEESLGAGRGMDIFSLADPSKPKWVSRVDFPVFKSRDADYWTPRVANGLAFCCDSHNGLFVVDVKEPMRPRVVDRFCVPQKGKDWPSGAISSCAVGEGCVYVTSAPGGLWTIPVDGVAPPRREKGAPPLHPEYREVCSTDTNIWHVYRPAASGQARSVVLRGDVAYVAFGDAGLHVLRLSKDGFEKLGELPGGRRVTDCCFVGDRLVTAEGLDGFAVYVLDSPTGFRETARRHVVAKDIYTSSVAFWCWPAAADRVILSPRHGAYQVVSLEDFNVAKPLLEFWAGCPWDKYISDGSANGHFPVMLPYGRLNWYDFTSDVPKRLGGNFLKPVPFRGSQSNGICRFGEDRFLYTIMPPTSAAKRGGTTAYYVFVESDGTYSEPMELPRVAAFGKGAASCFSGIPRASGSLVLMTNRSERKAVVWDFSDPAEPKVLRAYTLSGHPDIGTFSNGKAVIPAAHQGLLFER